MAPPGGGPLMAPPAPVGVAVPLKRPTYAAFATVLPFIAASRSARDAVSGRSSFELSAYTSNT